MIPRFPTFKPVELADRDAIDAYTGRFAPYSDFNFTSLWGWDGAGVRLLSELNGNLVVRFSDYRTQEPFFSFLGNCQAESTAQRLMEHSRKVGIATDLRLVPEVSIAGISDLRVREDRDNFDYLYSLHQHALLSGGDFKRARNFVRKFEREHRDACFRVIDLGERRIRDMLLKVLERWESQRTRSESSDPKHEREAIVRVLKTACSHPILSSGVFASDALLAFSIDEPLPNGHCICHFWKADISHAGVFEYLFHCKAKHLLAAGVETLNCEQDLGMEGLRKSKMSYRPVGFLRKYRVSTA